MKLSRILPRVILGIIIGAAIATVVGLLLPRTYTSTAMLYFPGAGRSSGGVSTARGDAAGGEGGASQDQPGVSIVENILVIPRTGTSPSSAILILNSRTVTEELISRFGLASEWGLPMELAIPEFRRVFRCVEGRTAELRLSFVDRTAHRAPELVTAAIEILTDRVDEMTRKRAQESVRFVGEYLKQSEKACLNYQKEIVALQEKVGGTTPDAQLQTLGQIYGDLQRQLTDAQVEASVTDSQMKATTDVSEKMIVSALEPSGTGNALLGSLYKTVVDREAELALLREKFTDQRPEVVQARQALAAARSSLDAEVARQLKGLKSGASPLVREQIVSVVTTRARVEGLQRSFEEVRQKLAGMPALQARYTQLNADLRDERTRLSLLRSQYSRAELFAQSREPQFVVVDPPTLPSRPNGYDLYYFVLFGGGAGGLLMLLIVAGRWVKRTIGDLGV
ncbi:MAG: hypothetical protein HY321_19190 [Armatimonadetes bacterium]|nr:hypothetical protein [Armatimonadota bacterium]